MTTSITIHYEVSDDASSEFDTVACILDALADRWAWHPYVHAFLITRAEEARRTEEYIQKNPQDVELSGA